MHHFAGDRQFLPDFRQDSLEVALDGFSLLFSAKDNNEGEFLVGLYKAVMLTLEPDDLESVILPQLLKS
jgi:hypothetical protein